jgi:hypothetical protein
VPDKEGVRTTVKVKLVGPDGKVIKELDGKGPDPFAPVFFFEFFYLLTNSVENGPIPGIFGNYQYIYATTVFPNITMTYLTAGPCVINCPNGSYSPPNGPGIWLFSCYPETFIVDGWTVYLPLGFPSNCLITGVFYYTPSTSLHTPLVYDAVLPTGVRYSFPPGMTSPSSPGQILYQDVSISQSMINTLGSPVTVSTIALVAALYGTPAPSPMFIPITFYVLSPPLTWSPNTTLTVTVTMTIPIGIAASPYQPSTSASFSLG